MKFRISAVSLSYVVLVLLFPNKSAAVPSYSRQTGLSCASCHYAPPELNAFGRKFKLEGYTFATKPEVSEDKKDHNSSLHLLESFPLSVLFDTSFTSTKSPQPATQNGNFEFPQAASLFLAGSWGSHVGSFVQVTYDSQADHFTWDNTDIRYANNSGHLFGKSLTYGATLNNNPTVEDLWNSTPAWGFPFGSSNSAPSPSAAAIVNGSLAQDVAGLDGYTDWAFDFQYDRTIPRWKNDVLSFRGTYIRENSSLVASFAEGAAAVASHHLNTVQGNIEYHFGTRFSGTVGYFDVTGTADPLLFAQAPVSGSANGSPQSNGYLLNFSWWPQQNIDLAVQYTAYARFNGAGTNYDGAGRNAAANNSTYLLVRFVF